MASCSFRPSKHSPATVIRFFKIVLRESLEDGNLKIPNQFTRKYGGGVANPVCLKPPDGTEWQVDWTKHDGGILFEKGWKDFASYYSLDHGHLMLFEYKETSHFGVHIFGMSGLEIDYPFNDQISDDSVEILNELPPRRRGRPKKRLKSPISSPSTSEKLRSAKKTRDVERSPNPQKLTQHVQTKVGQSEGTDLEMPIVAPVNQDLDVLKEAKKFKSENPSFIVKIRQHSLTRSGPPKFSIAFFRKYFKKNKQNVMIRSGRKLWPAKLIYYPLYSVAFISAGFLCFARASKLQAGDVCIFELVNRKDPVLDVHIYRGHGQAIH